MSHPQNDRINDALLDQITSIQMFQKDKPRFVQAKWHVKPGQRLNEPELISALLDYFYDNELKKKQE